MRQIFIRMFVALIMCGVTSVIRFGSLMAAPQVGTQTVWILRLITASLLSPLLFSLINKRTSNWTIPLKHRLHRLDDPSVLSIQPSAFDLINRPSRRRSNYFVRNENR
jgi:hypothetical protein